MVVMETRTTNDMADSHYALSLTENVPQGQGPPSSTRSLLGFLQDSVQELGQSTNRISSQAQSVEFLSDNANTFGYLPIQEVCLLYEQINSLTDTITKLQTTVGTLAETSEVSVIGHLLSHFDAKIRKIVREVLQSYSDQDILWRTAEECFEQAISPDGSLNANDYFDPLEEAVPEWPYDSGFDSEEYYDHENRLEIDEDYAAFRIGSERRSEAYMKKRQDWVDFWIRALNNSPNGPTLFYPPASLHDKSISLNVPKYLFRTFDAASSGRNDQSTIASTASKYKSQDRTRTDILSLEKNEAARLLRIHLTKKLFEGGAQDNLMSWTSSFLVAIQYAIYRAHIGRRHESDVKIYAVDTNKFPLGPKVKRTTIKQFSTYQSYNEDVEVVKQYVEVLRTM